MIFVINFDLFWWLIVKLSLMIYFEIVKIIIVEIECIKIMYMFFFFVYLKMLMEVGVFGDIGLNVVLFVVI